MRKTLQLFCCLLVLLVVLAGCAPIGFENIGDQLRAPVMNPEQSEIQNALHSYLGEEPQYIFPKEGEYLSPIIIADLDDDGVDEAVLLYAMPESSSNREKGTDVFVAVLEHTDSGWQVVQDVRGFYPDVASVEVVRLFESGYQLIVGFATSNRSERILAIYNYDSKGSQPALTELYRFPYSRYQIGDFSGRGATEIAIVRNSDVGGMQLQFLLPKNGQIQNLQGPLTLHSDFVECSNLMPGINAFGERILVVDGVTANYLTASQIVFVSGERFYLPESPEIVAATARQLPLATRDIDGDGVPEIPRILEMDLTTPLGYGQLTVISWADFSGYEYVGTQPVTKQFGLYDSERKVYIQLPDAWRDQLVLADGDTRGEWALINRNDNSLLLSLHLYSTGQSVPPNAIYLPGSNNAYLIINSTVSAADQLSIRCVAL